jgi:hypothetical protein
MYALGKVVVLGLLWWLLTSNVALPPVVDRMLTAAVIVLTVLWVFGSPPTNRIN